MSTLHILILAIIQGAAELLPVSSSAHVILAAKFLNLDPTRPEMTLLLVMLHTGTMFAVLVTFGRRWRAEFFQSGQAGWDFLKALVVATFCTGVIGVGLMLLIEKVILRNLAHAEVEMLFGNLTLISASLAVVGGLIMYSGLKTRRAPQNGRPLNSRSAASMGAIQGLCLPLRGFSRSGATISLGLLQGLSRRRAEAFSFALAVVLTPFVMVREVFRLVHYQHQALGHGANLMPMLRPSLLGMAFSFLAGLLALRWLSAWLERGRWHFFGIYCFSAAILVYLLSWSGV